MNGLFSSSSWLRAAALGAVCGLTLQAQTPKPIGEVFASDASVQGAVLLTGSGTSVLSGSSVVSGTGVARLRLTRGGEVRICPRTSVSVASAPNGRDLMLGMSSGALEAHYALPASADTIVTPDFRVLLTGPGNFHFVIGADAVGNTCIRTLQYNTVSLIVSELMGEGTYQVKPGEEVLFRQGKIADHVADAGACGCPAPALPVLRAAAVPPPPPSEVTEPPPLPKDAVHIEVEAPFIFRASDPVPQLDLAPQAARLRPARSAIELPVIMPPPEPTAEVMAYPRSAVATKAPRSAPRRILGKIGSFFAAIFK